MKRDVFGRYSVGYDCPQCDERLNSSIDDAGKPDVCPSCHVVFIVPGKEEHSRILEGQRTAQLLKEEDAARLRQEKQQRRQELAEAAARKQQDAQLRRESEQHERKKREQEQHEHEQRVRQQNRFRLCPSCKAEVVIEADKCDGCGVTFEARPIERGRVPRQTFVVVSGLSFVVISGIAFVVLLVAGYLWIRDSGLREQLKSCESFGVVNAKVSYEGVVFTDTVVFDLRDGGDSTARRIDPIHLLLQFAGKLNLHSVRRVILARDGRHVFYIESSDLRPLAESYAAGGRVWSFNHLPPNVKNMTGTKPYSEWTGGLLGVLKGQVEDLNDFIRVWTGY